VSAPAAVLERLPAAARPAGTREQLFSLAAAEVGREAKRRRGSPGWRAVAARVGREPLSHFVALGLLIFAGTHYTEARQQRYTIELDRAQLQRIATAYRQQYGTLPPPAVLRALADNYVREAVLLREGLALGLDRDDEIVRRRVAQKMEFLLEDRASRRDPDEAELRRWFDGHRAAYTQPAKRSFDHRYFAIDRRGEAAARGLAEAALARLQAGQPASAGDPFPGPGAIRLLSQNDTNRLFGGKGFAVAVFAAPQGRWTGAIRSSFGWHLVRVSEIQAPRPQAFEEVRDKVAADWRRADAAARNAAAFAGLRSRYTVVAPRKLP